jgi:hypothetical protein
MRASSLPFKRSQRQLVTDSFPNAARRHRSDAKHLATEQRFQNAGHLIGFAAECLAKELLEGAGIKIDKTSGFKVHFPDLQHRIRMQGYTRAMVLLAPIVGKPTFLDGWTADCRYEADILQLDAQTRFNSWVADVDSLFRAAGIP